jgi:hypothetical protein
LRKRVIKAQSKRVALGTTTIAQRIKAKGAQLARKATLRPTAPPAAPAAPVAGPSKSKAEETPEHERKRDREPSPDAYEPNPGKRKQFLESGLYCQDEEPSQDRMLVNRVLDSREPPKKRGPGRPRKSDTASVAGGSNEMSPIPRPEGEPVSFPPLPLEYHFNVFFGDEEREFLLPYNIMWESETGALDGKKRPPFYQKLRTSESRVQTPEPRVPAAGAGPGLCRSAPHTVLRLLPRASRLTAFRPIHRTRKVPCIRGSGRVQLRPQLWMWRQLHQQDHELPVRLPVPMW